jgi:triosephosphate isomerase
MKYIFGNWKMYLDLEESKKLATELIGEDFSTENELAIFPSTLSLVGVEEIVRESKFAIGAQDVFWTPTGAYTGAVSALMYNNAGCKYALVGHSERRYVFGETDDDVRKKIEACLGTGLIPVVCIGETKEEKDSGKREYRLKKQLMKAFDGLDVNGGSVIVTYEPVWAISKAGVGEPCSPAEADDVHGWIRLELKQYFSTDIPVLYGGSVNEKNVLDYTKLETVDGVLVGNASTKLESFLPLINSVK